MLKYHLNKFTDNDFELVLPELILILLKKVCNARQRQKWIEQLRQMETN